MYRWTTFLGKVFCTICTVTAQMTLGPEGLILSGAMLALEITSPNSSYRSDRRNNWRQLLTRPRKTFFYTNSQQQELKLIYSFNTHIGGLIQVR